MYKYQYSQQFFKSGNFIFSKDEITSIDCTKIEELEVKVVLKNGQEIIVNDIHAIELIM